MFSITTLIDSINLKINASRKPIYTFISSFEKGYLKSTDRKIKSDLKIKDIYPLQYKGYHFAVLVKGDNAYISLRGLRSYKGFEYQKHELLYKIMQHFNNNEILITRLDIAHDIRSKNDNNLIFRKFKVRRLTPYIPNPNRTLHLTTNYLEANILLKDGKRKKLNTYSYSYAKSIKSDYPYDILRHEIVYKEKELKKLKCNTIKDFGVKNIIKDIQDREYRYSYSNNLIIIDYKKSMRQIKTFFDYLKTGEFTPRNKRTFTKIKNTVKTKDEVLELLRRNYSNKEISTKLDIKTALVSSVNRILKRKG